MEIRAMKESDLDGAVSASAAAFDIDLSEPIYEQRWRSRVAYPLHIEPGGAFVAEQDGRIIGVAQVLRRERLWLLSLLTVDPGAQGTGAGRALMERALAYDDGTDAGLIVSSNNPSAMRLYARAGFSMLPTLQSEGAVDRASLPHLNGAVRDGDRGDLEKLAAISRDVRGAPHTIELEFALARGGQLLVVDDRGFTVAHPEWGVWLLVARDEEAARALLWAALDRAGSDDGRPIVRWLTADQQWAIEVLIRAGLRLTAYGGLCVSGNPGPLHPFVPSGPFA
jgi:GNAT superfamily N-acetyltransferase